MTWVHDSVRKHFYEMRCFIDMRKLLALIALIIPMVCSAVTSATSVVDKTVETIRKAPSISSNLTINARNGVSSGTFTLAGDRFVIDTDMASTWYDGKTLWSYSRDTNEVTITEPTADELAEINPFTFIKKARKDYTPRLLKSSPGTYTVELTPKSGKQEISKAVVTVDAQTYFIKNVALTINKHNINIIFQAMRTGKQLPDSHFRFNSKQLPKADINDLR